MAKHTNYFLTLITVLMFTTSICATNPLGADFDKKCKEERISFLASTPEGAQQKKTDAVIKAIKGDNTDLQSVRNGRNTQATISDNVIAEYVTPIARLYRPKNADKKLPILIYLHGGGWTIGSINSCSAFCNALAATGEVIVLALDYSLSPEFPYPHALQDCMNAYVLALDNAEKWGGDPKNISVGGDSSGGNLALSTAMQAKRDKLTDVKSLVLFYPVVKSYDDKSRSWKKYGNGYGLDGAFMSAFNDAYILGRNIVYDPLVSPYHAEDSELQTLPKILFVAAGKDILLDQGKAFCKKISKLGVQFERYEFKESCHLFITMDGQPTAFKKSVELTKDFLNK